MTLSGDWITAPATQAVCTALEGAGHAAFFVGGCVRNALMGVAVDDIDMATDAAPDAVMRLAEAAGLKPVPTGFDHGTITVVSDGKPHEVTTFREDVDTFGRHAEVAFGSDLEADARRRDFTMNALYARPDGTVIDPLGGIDDLHARRVRFIGDASARIREDYLRILRFFRFHAHYGDPDTGLDADALAACADNLDGLEGLSRERVGAEMRKLLSAPDPAPSVAAMQAAGVLAVILPGADAGVLAPLVHLEAQAATHPDAIRRLAALGGVDVAARLRLSRADSRRLSRLVEAGGSEMSAAELGYRFGHDAGRDGLLIRAAMAGDALDRGDLTALERGAQAVFPVAAADLKPAFTGPALGQRLREALEDTDAGGIVFHAKYLHYMERARTEWVRSCGVGLRAGLADNISYVVQRLDIHYAVAAKLDDELLATAEPVAFGRVSMDFRQRVLRAADRKLLCEGDVRVACIALDSGRPRRLPANMHELLVRNVQPTETTNRTSQE